MHRFKNIAITGARQAGKSTLANWLLKKMNADATGFRTVRYAVTDLGPLYEMVRLDTGASAPISRLLPEGIRGIPETFDGFGVALLAQIRACPAGVVLLDEIGRFERNSPEFLRELRELLDCEKTVVAVLKQEDLPHIRTIQARRDTLLIDLDVVTREQARQILGDWLGRP